MGKTSTRLENQICYLSRAQIDLKYRINPFTLTLSLLQARVQFELSTPGVATEETVDENGEATQATEETAMVTKARESVHAGGRHLSAVLNGYTNVNQDFAVHECPGGCHPGRRHTCKPEAGNVIIRIIILSFFLSSYVDQM
jgi:hypothetical protein